MVLSLMFYALCVCVCIMYVSLVTGAVGGDGEYGSAGALGAPSSSRARMLAQQRELQLKKRETANASGGMVRSSLDNPESIFRMGGGSDNQFTPAVRQFSAPKSVKDSSADAAEGSSEFGRSSRNKPVKLSRDRDDSRTEKPRKPVRSAGRAAPDDRGRNRGYYDDDDDAEEDYSRKPAKGAARDYDYDDEDSYNSSPKQGPSDWDKKSRKKDDRQFDDEWEKEESVPAKQPVASPAKGVRLRNREDTAGDFSQLDLTDMRKFLTTPLPKSAGTVQCNITRTKTSLTGHPVYSLYLKKDDTFLMCSKKRSKNKTSNYKICMTENDLSRDGDNYLGKLRSNFMGTEFQIFDNGHGPKDDPEDGEQELRNELGAVTYAANVWGSRGPRKMQVALPAVDEENSMVLSDPSSATGDELLNKIRTRNCRDVVYLINNPPRWNEQVGAYVLNFNGRVTMASVKNFQLVDPEERNTVVLQFGRVGKDEFTMDMHHPICPFQAFAVTMSSFDSKIACD